jgi:hypothetical protein
VQWWFKVSLETGALTWTSLRAIRSGIGVFSTWLSGQGPMPPWLSKDPAGVRVLVLEFLGHVRTLTASTGPNRGKPLSDLRVNDIATNVEQFYMFMHDHRESAARALEEPGWLRLGPQLLVIGSNNYACDRGWSGHAYTSSMHQGDGLTRTTAGMGRMVAVRGQW